ncbi:MAG: hypothetical protein QM758_03330 [Armatimonas sp.]
MLESADNLKLMSAEELREFLVAAGTDPDEISFSPHSGVYEA